jgi:hypothetical protein
VTYPLTYGPVYTIGVIIVPAIPLTTTARYFPPGVRQYYWVPSIATQTAPTRAELNAGTDLSGQVAAVSGWQLVKTRADVTPLGSAVTVMLDTIADPNSAANEFVIYASTSSTDARLLLPPGTAGFLVFLPEGDFPGRRCEVWPATVSTMFFDQDTETPGQIHFQFTVTGLPSQNVVIP